MSEGGAGEQRRGSRNGGRILVDQLRLHGAEFVFGVPGESYLAALDALHDVTPPRFIICRQEGGAAMMADAYGKLTGRPGIAFVTRGPGATNAASGVHVAQQDSTPMILLVGQIERATRGRDAFQEVDYRQLFGGMAKWVAEVDDPARLPELVRRAFVTATAGRPGPVVLALPEDVLVEEADVEDARPWQRVAAAPTRAALDALGAMLRRAERPFVILGGGGWNEGGCTALARFLEANSLPAAAGFRRQDIIPTDHPSYLGDVAIAPNPALKARITAADLLLVVGSRLSEMTTQGFTLLDIPTPRQGLVHIHNDPQEIGRVYAPELGIVAGLPEAAAALAELEPVAPARWAGETKAGKAEFEAWCHPAPIPGDVQLAEIVIWLGRHLPRDAIITNGAGNYCGWVNRFYPYGGFRTQLAPISGSMGYGLPAAVAAKLTAPTRTVVAFAGDGCFLMTGQELATAVQHELAIIVIVVNNGMFGTIRMHQERMHPGRVSGTSLRNPDFTALARAYGAHATRVTRTEDFARAFEAAQACGRTALIELVVDPEALTPSASLSAIRSTALGGGDHRQQA